MGIDGTAFAKVGERVRSFLAGKNPFTLVPCDKRGKVVAGAVGIGFTQDSRTEAGSTVADGIQSDGDLVVFVAGSAAVKVGGLYAYDGKVWKVDGLDPDGAAGSAWPQRVVLVRHAD